MDSYPRNYTPQLTTVDLSLEEHSGRVTVRSLDEVDPVSAQIESWMMDHDFPRIDRSAVSLVLREAVLNAVDHGRGSENEKQVQVTFAVRPNEVVAEVECRCSGFDPERFSLQDSPMKRDRYTGWGLFLAETYATWMNIDPTGNCFRFGRRRTEE